MILSEYTTHLLLPKLSQNLVAWNSNEHLLSHSFYGSGIQKLLSGCVWHRVSHCSDDICEGCCRVEAWMGCRITFKKGGSLTWLAVLFWQEASVLPGWASSWATWMPSWHGGWVSLEWIIWEQGRSHSVLYDLATYDHIAMSGWLHRSSQCIVRGNNLRV